MKVVQLLLLFALVPPRLATVTPPRRHCVPRNVNPPQDAFCTDPPVVPVNLPTYQGTWFLTYASDAALLFASDACTTANYTLNQRGHIDVLNCAVRNKGHIPSCVRAIASQRPNTTESGKLQVAFPTAPQSSFNPARYSVAALLGSPRFGYLAAAVYQCTAVPNARNQFGFFILSRTLRFRRLILYLLKLQLACSGYDVNVRFVLNDHKHCKYFFQSTAFEISSGARPSAPPPPFVSM